MAKNVEEASETTNAAENTDVRKVLRVPGFLISDTAIGLGDFVQMITHRAGIKPCGGCQKRAKAMNRLAHLEPR